MTADIAQTVAATRPKTRLFHDESLLDCHALIGVIEPGPLLGVGHGEAEPGIGGPVVGDPPGVGPLDLVPEPSGAVLADRVGRAPAVDVDGGLAGEPEDIALRDRVLQVLFLAWIGTIGAAVILG